MLPQLLNKLLLHFQKLCECMNLSILHLGFHELEHINNYLN